MTRCRLPVPGVPRFSVCLILDSQISPRPPLPLPSWACREHCCLGIRLGLWSQHDLDLLLRCRLPYLWSGLKSAQWSSGQIKWGEV